MSKQNAIEVHNPTKKYKGKAEPALDNISMNIPYGSILPYWDQMVLVKVLLLIFQEV